MKRFLGILLVIIFFVACGKSRPKDIFPEQKMIDILFDLHLADGYINSYPTDSLEKKKMNPYLSIYQKYGTDSAEVRKNLDYYVAHPQDMENVYAQISKRLKNEEETIQNLAVSKQREIFKQDSIAKKRVADSIHLVQRDSTMHFIGARDLFTKKDTTSAAAVKDAVMQTILNQQKRWEMTFYYFAPSNFHALTPLTEGTDQPKSVLKKEGEVSTEPIKERIPN